MFLAIANTPRPYAWGSATALAEMLGTEPSGGPEAELWLGAHSGSPSRILEPERAGGAIDLDEWIAREPHAALGAGEASGRLPFLLKLLAAERPLSLQAHPSADQALEGFTRENALGIPVDAPQRNYRDAYPKPEILYALSPTFEALCGFQQQMATRELVDRMLAAAPGEPSLVEFRRRLGSLRHAFEWLITRGDGVDELVAVVSRLAANPNAALGESPHWETVRMLAAEYPGDPGIVISLLLNRVTLRRGQAIFLPAGNIHAYLSGLGVELMTASDNVLRGGLTGKHIDVAELLSVLDFTPGPTPYLKPFSPSASVRVFEPDAAGFCLTQVTGDAEHELHGPAIVMCTEGEFAIAGASATTIARGHALYVTPDERALRIRGTGELFIAEGS